MRSRTHFEIELEEVGNELTLEAVRMESEADVLTYAQTQLRANVWLAVAALGEGVDFGNLLIEANVHGRCNLRALEHSGFYVNDISQEQALSALEYWLPSQDRTPDLPWQEE